MLPAQLRIPKSPFTIGAFECGRTTPRLRARRTPPSHASVVLNYPHARARPTAGGPTHAYCMLSLHYRVKYYEMLAHVWPSSPKNFSANGQRAA